jgi:diadenosine tetraphosphate (Ap4A) HIT family hydrolase
MCIRWDEEPQLRIAELERCYVLLNRDQFFPGYTFVFAKAHVTELFHLEAEARRQVMEEVSAVAAALARVFNPAKMNYELLGNMVPHLHWHLVPRFTDDPLWPRPIWSEPHAERPLSAEEYRETIDRIRAALRLPGGSRRLVPLL